MGMHRGLLGLLVVLTAILAGPGCIKYHLKFTVYPDRSGKVEVENRMTGDLDLYTLFEDTLEMLEEMGGEVEADKIRRSFERSMFDRVGEQFKGLDAWTLPTWEKEGDESSVYNFTCYFDDINKLRIKADEEETIYESFSFREQDDGTYEFRALMHLKKVRGAVKRSEEEMEEARKELVEAMEGWEATYTVYLPGEAVEGEGREATFHYEAKELTDLVMAHMENPKKNRESVIAEVRCKPDDDLAEEKAIFDEEMAGAVKEWKAQKKALRRVKPLGK